MKTIKAKDALIKNAQHFGTDRPLRNKLMQLFGDNVSIGDLLDFNLNDFMEAGLNKNLCKRLVQYLKYFGHVPKDYAFANSRTGLTNVDLTAKSKNHCDLHTLTRDDEDKIEEMMNDPWYQDNEPKDVVCTCN